VAEEDAGNAELVAGLNRIADMMALIVVRGRKQDDQIRLLDALGYPPTQIAAFLGIRRANTVSAALSRARKKTTSRKKVSGRKVTARKKVTGRKKVTARKKVTEQTRSARKKPTSR